MPSMVLVIGVFGEVIGEYTEVEKISTKRRLKKLSDLEWCIANKQQSNERRAWKQYWNWWTFGPKKK